jgi:hypothetical protein
MDEAANQDPMHLALLLLLGALCGDVAARGIVALRRQLSGLSRARLLQLTPSPCSPPPCRSSPRRHVRPRALCEPSGPSTIEPDVTNAIRGFFERLDRAPKGNFRP